MRLSFTFHIQYMLSNGEDCTRERWICSVCEHISFFATPNLMAEQQTLILNCTYSSSLLWSLRLTGTNTQQVHEWVSKVLWALQLQGAIRQELQPNIAMPAAVFFFLMSYVTKHYWELGNCAAHEKIERSVFQFHQANRHCNSVCHCFILTPWQT